MRLSFQFDADTCNLLPFAMIAMDDGARAFVLGWLCWAAVFHID